MAQPIDYRSEPPHDPYIAFRYGPFRLYTFSWVAAVIASQLLATTAGWELYRITKQEIMLGWLGLVQALPVIFLSLLAGHAVDTYSRKSVLIVTQVFLVACPLGLAITAMRGLHAPAWIYAAMFVNAVALTFARPARGSMLPRLVPPEVFPNAVTWNSSVFSLTTIVGPALAGFMIAYAGVSATLYTSAAFMALCMVMTFFLPDPGPAKNPQRMNLRSLTLGLKFVMTNKLMLGAMGLDMFAVMLGGAMYILPALAAELGTDEVGFGWMRAAPAIGAGLMAFAQAHRRPWQHAGRAMLLAVVGFGAATIVLGLSKNYWLSLGMLLLIGVFDNISVVVRHSLVQLLTPDAMRGRVTAVNQVFIGSSNELGGLESGLTAQWMGLGPSVVFGGAGAIVITGLVAWMFPQIRQLGRLNDVQPPADPLETAGVAQEPN